MPSTACRGRQSQSPVLTTALGKQWRTSSAHEARTGRACMQRHAKAGLMPRANKGQHAACTQQSMQQGTQQGTHSSAPTCHRRRKHACMQPSMRMSAASYGAQCCGAITPGPQNQSPPLPYLTTLAVQVLPLHRHHKPQQCDPDD